MCGRAVLRLPGAPGEASADVSVTDIQPGRSFTGGVTNASTTLTCTGFTSNDVGRCVTANHVPLYTEIQSVTNSTTAVMTKAATATAASQPVTVEDWKLPSIRLLYDAVNGATGPVGSSGIIASGTLATGVGTDLVMPVVANTAPGAAI